MTAIAKTAFLVFVITIALPLPAQVPPAPEPIPPHDITGVDPAPEGGAIATPPLQRGRRNMRRYETPELTGARQAIGSQLVNGELPRPLLDYAVRTAAVYQRISFFEGGLVVIRMTGAGGTIHKRVIVPEDAAKSYLEIASADALRRIRPADVSDPTDRRLAFLRVYEAGGKYVERAFDPSGKRPKKLQDQITPLEDLLRVLSEDRTVTSTVANYTPQVGDELIADDRKVWRVARIIEENGIVELRCTTAPTIMYVAAKDLYNYFVGRTAED